MRESMRQPGGPARVRRCAGGGAAGAGSRACGGARPGSGSGCSSIAAATSSFSDADRRRFILSGEPFVNSSHPQLLLSPLYPFEPSPNPLPYRAELPVSKLCPPPPSSVGPPPRRRYPPCARPVRLAAPLHRPCARHPCPCSPPLPPRALAAAGLTPAELHHALTASQGTAASGTAGLRAASGERRGGRGAGSAGGSSRSAGHWRSGERRSRTARARAGMARVAASGPVGSDVAVHVGGQRWSEVFWTSSDTLE